MSKEALKEMMAGYADDLNRGEVDLEAYLDRLPERAEELRDLLLLTENLKEALVPVQPSPTFVKNLLQQLMVAPREESTQPTPSVKRWVVLGAAALGSILSIVGLVTYLVKNRMNPKAQAVGSV